MPPTQTPIFEFMALRSPVPVDQRRLQRSYVHDDEISTDGRRACALFSEESRSEIARQIYQLVFCSAGALPPLEPNVSADPNVIPAVPIANMAIILQAVVARLEQFNATCPFPPTGVFEALQGRRYHTSADRYYLIPDELDRLEAGHSPHLAAILDILQHPPLTGDHQLDRVALVKALAGELGMPIIEAVFLVSEGTYCEPYRAAKRELFDRLYLLYLARRLPNVQVSLERTMLALAALHVLEVLALDEIAAQSRGMTTVPANWTNVLAMLTAVHPSLRRWNRQAPAPAFPALASLEDLRWYLAATPVVHPLFARLYGFRRPFNTVQPLGIGDLKVVKQWLCGYRAADIAHVENVLAGEKKSRQHRRLERSETTVSYTSEQTQDAQQDQQSTDRFELKREAEAAIKTDLAINARGSVTYKGAQVVAEVGAGMAYNRSQNDVSKSAENYSREVVAKAVKRIQSRVMQERSTTKTFEVEETNVHKLTNTPENGHISGIYRWLEKVYRAQLFNYGKRMMFELVLPEPAAFLVESKLRAYESSVELPIPPKPPILPSVVMPAVGPTHVPLASPTQIDKSIYDELRTRYDLSSVPYRPEIKRAFVIDPVTGQTTLSRKELPDNAWSSTMFRTNMNAQGYVITHLYIDGFGHGQGRRSAELPDVGARGDNTIVFYVQGQEVRRLPHPDAEYFSPFPIAVPSVSCDDDDVVLTIGTMDYLYYDLSVSVELTLSDEARLDWKTGVFNVVRAREQARVDEESARLMQAYESELASYRSRVEQLRAVAINELLQGEAPARNQEIMRDELKRQCIAMLAKEFDADETDDVLGRVDLVGSRDIDMVTHTFTVTELPASGPPASVAVEFHKGTRTTAYAAPRRGPAMRYGRYIQFLEQAFEWHHLSFVTYPYFWAHAPKWVELMNRSDPADPAFSAFLQAGSVKVLLAVTPAYDQAVLHFLATGEPWDGGPAPVIGDQLYMPLYEELRLQQDDLAGAVPDGEPWTFTVPTSLVYLENSSTPLPPLECPGVTL